MKYRVHSLYDQRIAVIAFVAAACLCAHAGESTVDANAQFARDFYASRVSMLMTSDSSNTLGGGGVYVPYYEGFIQCLPDEVDLCGFRASGSTGNTGVNDYMRFSGGSSSQLVSGRVFEFAPGLPINLIHNPPPGPRYEIQVIPEGMLRSNGTNRFSSNGLTNLAGIYPDADNWGQNETLILRTPFYVSDDGSMIESVSMSLLTDHDGSAGLAVHSFDPQPRMDIQFSTDHIGLQLVDAVFENTPTTRIGVRFSGDTDLDDSDEPGKRVVWFNPILYKQKFANANHGFYIDNISAGGFSVFDQISALDPDLIDDFFQTVPRPFNASMIWLGQNAESDEWNGELGQIWGERIEELGDIMIQAGIDAGYAQAVTPVLITPPRAEGTYPNSRFAAMNEALDEIASRRGWVHFDFHSLVGDSLGNINPDFVGGNPHPSQSGTTFVLEKFYRHLNCLRAEFSGDDTRNFFDVSAFLMLYNSNDPKADMNGDGALNFFDVSAFLTAFNADCP